MGTHHAPATRCRRDEMRTAVAAAGTGVRRGLPSGGASACGFHDSCCRRCDAVYLSWVAFCYVLRADIYTTSNLLYSLINWQYPQPYLSQRKATSQRHII